jgi:hypothetical protein
MDSRLPETLVFGIYTNYDFPAETNKSTAMTANRNVIVINGTIRGPTK